MGGERVNLLMLSAGLGLGGAETVIRHLAQAIDPARFRVTIGCIKTLGVMGEQLQREGADIVRLTDPAKPGVDYFTALKLRRLIAERNIHLVHTHTTDGLADAAVCRLMSRRVRVLHTFHFGNYPHTGARLLWMERVFSRMVDRLVAVGEVQRAQIRQVFGLSERRLGMIWNGVPPAAAAGDPGFRERIGAGNRLLIGTVATLIEQKGLRDLIAVAARLRAHADRVCFVVTGDGHLRPELERLRREQQLDHMVLLPGWVPNAVSVAVPEFDIFFQPSLWEAMSVAVLEAMAAGKPVVATRVGENPRILDHDVDGWLVDVGDVPGMADALERLIADPARRAAFGQAAAAKVARQFTVERMARTYEQLYLEMVGR